MRRPTTTVGNARAVLTTVRARRRPQKGPGGEGESQRHPGEARGGGGDDRHLEADQRDAENLGVARGE
jgi:hypothetical protein